MQVFPDFLLSSHALRLALLLRATTFTVRTDQSERDWSLVLSNFRPIEGKYRAEIQFVLTSVVATESSGAR